VPEAWTLRGELILSCNCTVFCPCVLSLGQHPPTEGYCQTWAGVRIDEGRFGSLDLSGINLALIMDVPGPLARGNWTTGLVVDEKAPQAAVDALTTIFTGRAGGSTHLLSILVAQFLGVQQAPIAFRTEGQTRVLSVGRIIEGAITPIRGKNEDAPVMARNSSYWIAPDIILAQADKSRLRAFGRNWNFAGRSAEICHIDWSNREGR